MIEKAVPGVAGKERGTNMDSGVPMPVLYNHNYSHSSDSNLPFKLPEASH